MPATTRSAMRRAPMLRTTAAALFATILLTGAARPATAQTEGPGADEQPTAPLSISFDGPAVVVAGAAPGGEVLLYGLTRERHPYFWRQVSERVVLLADASGSAAFEVAYQPDSRSLWIAAEAASGRFTLASAPGFTAEEVEFPGRGLVRSETGLLRVLESRFGRTELVYLRPGVGAWWSVAVDGAETDSDRREDEAASLSLDSAQAFWGLGEPPAEFAVGDVLVAVSLDDLRFFAARLTPPGESD